jgi:hypothetical protein
VWVTPELQNARVTDSVVATSLRDVFGKREVLQKETKKVES